MRRLETRHRELGGEEVTGERAPNSANSRLDGSDRDAMTSVAGVRIEDEVGGVVNGDAVLGENIWRRFGEGQLLLLLAEHGPSLESRHPPVQR